MSIVRKHIFASGRVQGVGYRYFVMETAHALGIKGWVRNLRDGRVEADLEADEAAMERMIAALRKGPMMSHVNHLEIETPAELTDFDAFRVLSDA